MYRLRSLLETGYIDEALDYVMSTLDQYTSEVFEDVVEEPVPDLHRAGLIRTRPVQVGRWWHKDIEIDLVVREPGVSSTFIEVKWKTMSEADARRELSALEKRAGKTGLQSPENYYLLVTRELEGEIVRVDEHRLAVDLHNDRETHLWR